MTFYSIGLVLRHVWANNDVVFIIAATVPLRRTQWARGSDLGQRRTWQNGVREIDGRRKWIEGRREEKRGEERSVTPEHIKYFMRCVVQQRQERAWSERLAQLIYSTRTERERWFRCVFGVLSLSCLLLHYKKNIYLRNHLKSWQAVLKITCACTGKRCDNLK